MKQFTVCHHSHPLDLLAVVQRGVNDLLREVGIRHQVYARFDEATVTLSLDSTILTPPPSNPEPQQPTPMPVIEVPKPDADHEIAIDKALRRDIDVKIQELKSASPSRERSLAITKLQEAVMWLGMDLKRINEESPGASPNPYPNSKDPSNTKIEPTADGLKL